MKISYDPFSLSEEELARLYEAANHGSYGADGFLEEKFKPGAYGVVCLDDLGVLLGVARVFSDDAGTSWIAELVVPPSESVGKIKSFILAGVVERFGHTAIFSESFPDELECYTACGISPKSRLTAVSRGPTLEKVVEPESYMH